MRLNNLKISGFKSFPERAQLAFDTGVTAIVGPNGCGKSNVIDAITWVLGEQSARSLRGERMEDVIFNGSDARRPTGTAEVRLQLSQVTAALTGLGEDLFVDERTFGKGVSDQSDSNGNGSESISNVSHADEQFSNDNEASIQKVEKELDREFNESPYIARDVEVGRRLYRSGESEYLINGRVCRLRDIQDLLMDSGVGIKAYAIIEQGKIGQILSARPLERRQLLEEAAGITKYKNRRRSAELKLEAAQQNLTRVDDVVFEVEKQRRALKRQAAKARRYRRLREELRRWEKALFAQKGLNLLSAIEEVKARLNETRVRENTATAALSIAENDQERVRIEFAELERKSTSVRESVHAHELSVTALHHVIANIESSREKINEDFIKLEGEVLDVEQESQKITKKRTETETALIRVKETIEYKCVSYSDSETNLSTARRELELRTQDLQTREHNLASLSARLKSLEEFIASREGYSDATRLVLEELPGNLGSVADYIEVDQRYTLAVENCLDDLLQYVLVRHQKDVLLGIKYVETKNAGRCGFLVVSNDSSMDTFEPVPPAQSLTSLLKLVSIKKGPAKNTAQQLLKHLWFAPSFEIAAKASHITDDPIVTPEGTVFRSSVIIQIGEKKETRGVLGTKSEIRELRDLITSEKKAVQLLSTEIRHFTDITINTEAALKTLAVEQHACEKELLEFELVLAGCDQELSRLLNKSNMVKLELSKAREERDVLDTKKSESELQLDTDTKKFDSSRDEVRSIDERIFELRENSETQSLKVRESRDAFEKIRAEVTGHEVSLAKVEADYENLLDACRDSLNMNLDEVQIEVEKLKRDDVITSDITLMVPSDEDLDEDELPVSENNLSDLNAESVDVVNTVDSSAGPLSIDEAINQLRNKIDRLGPVNMMAIDQFDELDQRYEFLTTQRKDLLDSIQATEEAIKRIDITTRERFKDAFTAVNENFQKTFSTLFGGGQAALVLLDENDLLESGIDIIAQPPGKRLQSIQLLSGGEKALAALALMFAIFKYKPSPFCLLDEIDAPLDDANISRFVDMLRGLQDHTQFVLVTHNRKTMEIADRLYGVTMEEPGVSKLISVEFN